MSSSSGEELNAMDRRAISEGGDRDAHVVPVSSQFTPINRVVLASGPQLLTPDPSLHRPTVGDNIQRFHNPVVAQYCGIGPNQPSRPSQLELCFPMSPSPSTGGNPSLKRTRQAATSKSARASEKASVRKRVPRDVGIETSETFQLVTPQDCHATIGNSFSAHSGSSTARSIRRVQDRARSDPGEDDHNSPLLNPNAYQAKATRPERIQINSDSPEPSVVETRNSSSLGLAPSSPRSSSSDKTLHASPNALYLGPIRCHSKHSKQSKTPLEVEKSADQAVEPTQGFHHTTQLQMQYADPFSDAIISDRQPGATVEVDVKESDDIFGDEIDDAVWDQIAERVTMREDGVAHEPPIAVSRTKLHIADSDDENLYDGIEDDEIALVEASSLLEPVILNASGGVSPTGSSFSDGEHSNNLESSTLLQTATDKDVSSKTSLASGITSGKKATDSSPAFTPIVRPPFPARVRDRSPIIGLSPDTVLRTCFRIGEAINAGSAAVKDEKDVLVELYARVLSSHRDHTKQDFVLCDLFHKRPPYINATYNASIWRGVQLYEFDSRWLLQQFEMCRCMGKMKKSGTGWEFVISNIWPAKWDDVFWVEGIVNFKG